MPGDDFDMASALSEMSEGLGFDAAGDSGGASGTQSPDNSAAPAPSPAGKDTTGSSSPAPAPAEASQAAAPGVTSPAPQPTDPTAEPPKTWRKEAAAHWNALPPDVRQEIAKREQDIFKGIEGYKQSAALGDNLRQVLSPYLPTLQRYGVDPMQQIGSLMRAHYTLALGAPEEKAALFKQLADDYKIDLGQLSGAAAPYIDPAVKALQDDLAGVRSELTAAQRARAAEAQAKLASEIDAFAKDPANPYFEEVGDDIAQLIRSGVAKTLKEAYDKAVWLNPVVRAKEVARQQAEQAAKAAKEESERVAKARSATSANVRTSERGGSTAAPTGTMDDTLSETLAAIRNRA